MTARNFDESFVNARHDDGRGIFQRQGWFGEISLFLAERVIDRDVKLEYAQRELSDFSAVIVLIK